MLLMTIAALFVLTEKTNGGLTNTHLHPKISLKLPKIESNFEEIQQETINQFLPKTLTESAVSYSVPFENYHELNGHTNNLLSDNIKVTNAIGDLKASIIANEQNNLDNNEVLQYNNPASRINQNIEFLSSVNIPATSPVTVLQPIKEQKYLEVQTLQPFDINNDGVTNVDLQAPYHNNVEYNDITHLNIPIVNAPTLHLQSNPEFATQEHLIEQDIGSDLDSQISSQNVYPNIVKHIYFHVPPPEIEEPSERTVIPKTKHVNMVFIKVPFQQRKDVINQVAPIEERTIIYIISKKPSSEQVYLPKAVTPHEVFFVKYNGSAESAVTQISDNLDEIENR